MTASPFVRRNVIPFERRVLFAWADGRILSIDAQMSLGLGSHDELLERAMRLGSPGRSWRATAERATVGLVGALVGSGRSSRP